MLVDKGVLHKRRGLGMFVSPGAHQKLLDERRQVFAQRFVQPLMTEAGKLGLSSAEVSRMIDRFPGASQFSEASGPAVTNLGKGES